MRVHKGLRVGHASLRRGRSDHGDLGVGIVEGVQQPQIQTPGRVLQAEVRQPPSQNDGGVIKPEKCSARSGEGWAAAGNSVLFRRVCWGVVG